MVNCVRHAQNKKKRKSPNLVMAVKNGRKKERGPHYAVNIEATRKRGE